MENNAPAGVEGIHHGQVRMAKNKKLLSPVETTVLAVLVVLIALHAVFWRFIGHRPLVSLGLVALTVLGALGWWLWHNYRVVGVRAGQVLAIEERLEGIIYSLFFPRGFDLLAPLRVDEQNVGWAILRDESDIPVALQYFESINGRVVDEDDLRRLIERMNVDNTPKGICLTTGEIKPQVEEFARRNNILTRNGDQLLEMLHRAEEEKAGAAQHICPNCGSHLVESTDVTDLWRCPNPNCRKEYKEEELEQGAEGSRKKGRRVTTAFTIDCYGCGRPVELDTTMSGLMECPYDDCSWIINVDNELLALRGGLDKRVSERLAEIKCPRCNRMIKVPADAEGLMECPCEEKWIIDVGAALGERAQAQIADSGAESSDMPQTDAARRIEALDFSPAVSAPQNQPDLENMSLVERALYQANEMKRPAGAASPKPESPETFKLERPAEAVPAAEGELMVDCPSCGAGVPARLDVCPVCRSALKHAEGSAHLPEISSGVPSAPPREVVHRHTFLALSSRFLLLFFLLAAGAFLAFVYFMTR